MLRIRITFDANPDSLYLFGADPVTDLFLTRIRICCISLVRIRLLNFFWRESGFALSLWSGSGYWSFFYANPDSLYLFGADPVTEFICTVCEYIPVIEPDFFLLQVWRNEETLSLLRSRGLHVHDWTSVQAFGSWCTGDTAGSQICRQRREQ